MTKIKRSLITRGFRVPFLSLIFTSYQCYLNTTTTDTIIIIIIIIINKIIIIICIIIIITIILKKCSWGRVLYRMKNNIISVEINRYDNSLCEIHRGGSRIFFRRGCTRLLLYFNTNKPHRFFFCRIPNVLENRRSSRGGGGAHPLHPPLRSTPDSIEIKQI